MKETVVLAMLVSIVWLFIFVSWMKDINFYRKNSWDYTKSSGQKMYHSAGGAFSKPYSNKGRVWGGYPFMLVGFAIVIFSFFFA